MTLDDLRSLLNARSESQTLEFKRDAAYDLQTIICSILAMSNVRDGGTIVIGIEDDPVKLTGVSENNLITYDQETMMDQAAEFGVPSPRIGVEIIVDERGELDGPVGGKYLVIQVKSFDDTPVICRRDSGKTSRGQIYYRSTSGRPQSSRVSNETDMRAIIETAAIRLRQHWSALGLQPIVGEEGAPSGGEKIRKGYDDELGDL